MVPEPSVLADSTCCHMKSDIRFWQSLLTVGKAHAANVIVQKQVPDLS